MAVKTYEVEKGEKYFFYIDKKSGKLSYESFGLRLKETIDVDVLIKATEECLKLFPLFQLKPVLDESGQLFLANNDEPVPVFEAPIAGRKFGTKDTNKYLFAVTYKNADIQVFAHHSLGDGRMILRFLFTLAYHYFTLKGYAVEANGYVVTEETLSDKTILSSMLADAFQVEIDEPHGVYTPQNVLDYVQTQGENWSSSKAFIISWNQSDMMRDCKAIGVTVAAYMNAAICEAMVRCNEIGDHHIVAGVPVDMREKMNSVSQRNYIGNVRIPFLPEWKTLSFEEKALKLKEQLTLQTDFSNILSRVRSLGPVVDKLIEGPLYEEGKMKLRQANKRSGITAQTFLLTNIGRIQLPQTMMEHIEKLLFQSQPCLGTMIFVPYSFGEDGYVIIGQGFKNDSFVDQFVKILDERGIPATCEAQDMLDDLELGIEEFERI